MPFSFRAVGERDDAAAQLRAAAAHVRPGAPDDALKSELAAVLAKYVEATEMNHVAGADISWRQVYVIEAEGHSGGSALDLTLTVRALHVPAVSDPGAGD